MTKGTDSFAFPAGGTVVELASSTESPPEIRERALRVLAGRARDADDARYLMQALGLVPEPPRERAPRRLGEGSVIRSVRTEGEDAEAE
ncbi:MAG: hypothetical protein JF587_19795 [Catenulisporales bacterium]|nr:hypothetical protein [Catenulisporales bacterium]